MTHGFTNGFPVDVDNTLAADSDSLVPSQKAIKAYVDNGSFWNRISTDLTPTTSGDSVTMSGRFKIDKGADITAAGDLTLGTDGNFFKITGNTTVNAITTSNWQAGSEVTLWFSGTPTVSHNTAGGGGTALIQLDSQVSMSAVSGTILKLIYDGTVWREIGRSFPGA